MIKKKDSMIIKQKKVKVSKKIKGGDVEIDGRFIEEKIKDLVDKGLENELKEKYINAHEKVSNDLKMKKDLYEKELDRIEKEKKIKYEKKKEKEKINVVKKSGFIAALYFYGAGLFSIFTGSGPLSHLVIFIIVVLIIYLIFYGVASMSSSNQGASDNGNIAGSSSNFLRGTSNKFDNYKYYNTDKFNFLNLFLPTSIMNNINNALNNVIYKPFGKDLYINGSKPREEITTGRSNNIINININDTEKTNIILKPKDIKISYNDLINNIDMNNLPSEIFNDNIKESCDLTLNDKKNIYIPHKVDNNGLYVLDIDNLYYLNKDNTKILLEKNEKFISNNSSNITNIIKYPFII